MSLQAAKVRRPDESAAQPPLSPDEQKRRFGDLCETLDGDAIEQAGIVPLRPKVRPSRRGAAGTTESR